MKYMGIKDKKEKKWSLWKKGIGQAGENLQYFEP